MLSLSTRVERRRKFGEVSCTECILQENGFVFISMVNMEAINTVKVILVVNFRRSVIIAELINYGGLKSQDVKIWLTGNRYKNSSGDEIANVNFLTTISHTRRPTSKYRKRDKPTSFNNLDDR